MGGPSTREQILRAQTAEIADSPSRSFGVIRNAMRVPLLLAFGVLAGVIATDVSAQTRGGTQTSGTSIRNSAPTLPVASARGRSARPPARLSAPPSNLLPPLSNGPNPIVRPAGPNDTFRATPRTYAPRYGRLSALRGGGYDNGYSGGYVDAGYGSLPYIPDVAPSEGRLNLYVSPASAQVLVDGFYVGTVADYQDRSLWLESGPRRIELRADGYQPAAFDLQVIEDRIVDYRRDLVRDGRSAAAVEAPRPPAIPKTFYVIPGCYAGDTPPAADRLPSGCSSKNLKTVPPAVSRVAPPAGPQDGTRPKSE
jgi:hypothetical protein